MRQPFFTLGDWTVRPSHRVIERGDERTSLEPKVMDVLATLASHAPDVVSADELLATCWAGQFYGDNPVHKAIAQLRRSLGDDARTPRYVATIRKRGYRVIAPVLFPDRYTCLDPPSDHPPLPTSARHRHRRPELIARLHRRWRERLLRSTALVVTSIFCFGAVWAAWYAADVNANLSDIVESDDSQRLKRRRGSDRGRFEVSHPASSAARRRAVSRQWPIHP
jgi:DNA-binding winged helix-turn-helix (wHTH) protein